MSTRRAYEKAGRLRRSMRAGDRVSLLNALEDPDSRALALKYLAELGDPQAGPSAMDMLASENPGERIDAAKALGVLRWPEAVSPLIDIATSDPVQNVRLWAIAALGEIGDTTVSDSLGRFLKSDDWNVRRATALALGRLGDPDAVQLLAEAKKSESWFRRGAYRRAINQLNAPARIARRP